MECTECGYYYKAEEDEHPRCHFEGPEGWAPCEQEEDEETEDIDEEEFDEDEDDWDDADDDCGFDPYLGCYTDDC